jgi:methionyl-tRNA synthetase
MNYITGLGYKQDGESSELYNKYWPADIHLIGKDILRFHTIYWPIMLMALDLPLPKQVFGHPWVLMNHNKMSKSKGNVIYTDSLVKYFGVDAVRYYVLHEIPFAADGNLTYELVCEKSNSDLANTLGNLVNRTIAMIKKYFGDEAISSLEATEFDDNLKATALNAVREYKNLMDQYRVADGIEAVIRLLRHSNKYIDETAPWILAKDEANKAKLSTVLYNLLESIRIAASMLEPIIPSTAKKIYEGLQTNLTSFDDLSFGKVASYIVNPIEVLFKRLDVKEIMEDVVKNEEKKSEPKKEEPKVEAKPLIEYDDFAKLDLCVGKIIEAKCHPKADRLLVFKVDLGTEVRQIVSGIAKYYKPDELVGRKVIVVKNLKPIKLRGEESQGMLLCASNADDSKLELISINELEAGDLVS